MECWRDGAMECRARRLRHRDAENAEGEFEMINLYELYLGLTAFAACANFRWPVVIQNRDLLAPSLS